MGDIPAALHQEPTKIFVGEARPPSANPDIQTIAGVLQNVGTCAVKHRQGSEEDVALLVNRVNSMNPAQQKEFLEKNTTKLLLDTASSYQGIIQSIDDINDFLEEVRPYLGDLATEKFPTDMSSIWSFNNWDLTTGRVEQFLQIMEEDSQPLFHTMSDLVDGQLPTAEGSELLQAITRLAPKHPATPVEKQEQAPDINVVNFETSPYAVSEQQIRQLAEAMNIPDGYTIQFVEKPRHQNVYNTVTIDPGTKNIKITGGFENLARFQVANKKYNPKGNKSYITTIEENNSVTPEEVMEQIRRNIFTDFAFSSSCAHDVRLEPSDALSPVEEMGQIVNELYRELPINALDENFANASPLGGRYRHTKAHNLNSFSAVQRLANATAALWNDPDTINQQNPALTDYLLQRLSDSSDHPWTMEELKARRTQALGALNLK